MDKKTKTLFRFGPTGDPIPGFPLWRRCYPVVIGGAGRTGTSLVLSLIGALDDVAAVPFESQALVESETERGQYDGLLMQDTLPGLFNNKPTATRWAEKSPQNILHFGHIFELLGGRLCFIALIRDGRNSCTSTSMSYSADPIRRSEQVQSVRDDWLIRTALALDLVQKYPANVMVVRYELLTSNPEIVFSDIARFIGSPIQPGFWQDWPKDRLHHDPSESLLETGRIKRDKIKADPDRWRSLEGQKREVVNEFRSDPRVESLLCELGYPK